MAKRGESFMRWSLQVDGSEGEEGNKVSQGVAGLLELTRRYGKLVGKKMSSNLVIFRLMVVDVY